MVSGVSPEQPQVAIGSHPKHDNKAVSRQKWLQSNATWALTRRRGEGEGKYTSGETNSREGPPPPGPPPTANSPNHDPQTKHQRNEPRNPRPQERPTAEPEPREGRRKGGQLVIATFRPLDRTHVYVAYCRMVVTPQLDMYVECEYMNM